MRINVTKTKSNKNYYIIDDYNKFGKRSTKVVKKLGTEAEILILAKKENITLEEWLSNSLNDFKDKHKVEEAKKVITIERCSNKRIAKDTKNLFNVGYLFLNSIYNDLKINEIINEISEKYKFTFDLNEIFKTLISSRIIYPSSKLKTHELSKNFIEEPKIKLHNLYRGLSYLCKEMELIQEKLFEHSKEVLERDTDIIYFDCTNYFFEIDEEDDFRKYGINKQHQPSPQVGMGLFLDKNGIPVAFNIYPGNESETKQLLPTEKEIIEKYKLTNKKIILCTDAALCTDEIKSYNVKDKRGFVITQSLKKLKEEQRNEALDPAGWRIEGNLNTIYNLDDIRDDEKLKEKYKKEIFYKIIQTETKSVKQDLIVTYSVIYDDYKKAKRQTHIEKAEKKINNTKKDTKISISKNQNDYRRFILETAITKEKEEATEYKRELDEALILEEEKYDGFYALTTNLIDDIGVILNVARGRWEIEESFRIMKHDFLARPVELSREERIKAHFLTCFIALLIYRILEKKLDNLYTTEQIISTLKAMNVVELKGDGYTPGYTRTNLTDDLHEIFGFRTDYEITTYEDYDKIFNKI